MNENLDSEMERLMSQYLFEKSLYERFGAQSIINFEEWLDIKNIKFLTKYGNEIPDQEKENN